MANREPISDDSGRRQRPAAPSSADRTAPRVEYRPPPTTVERGRGVGFWILVAVIIAAIVIGLLFWSGVL